MTAPEFSRTVRLDTLGERPREIGIEADEEERAALAARFGLAGIARLAATVSLTRKGEDIAASGTLEADVTQSCVATGAPVEAALREPFDLLFRPRPGEPRPEEEIELEEGDLDTIFHDGATIDLGEAAAQTLLLNLDPYPRAQGAEAALRAAGVKSEGEAGPFGGRATLRDKLKGADE